jgi:integrase
MAIFKRGEVYWFNFWWDDHHVQRSTRQANRGVARQIESAFRTALAKGDVGITERKPVPPFSVAMRDFLKLSEQQHKAHPRTHLRYVISSRALLRYFKDASVDRISSAEVERFKTQRAVQKGERTKRTIRPATVNRELACLKAMFNFLIGGDVALANPVSKVKFLPEDNEQMRVLAFDEQRRYLAAATSSLRDIAVLMLETGMRPEEVYRIRVENVCLESGFIFNPSGKTKAARRKVNLTADAARVLAVLLEGATGPYLFPHSADPNRPMPKVNNAHDRALKASGVRQFRLYDLRHTFATRAAMAGVDLVTLAAMLGHSRIQMVLRYAHPTEEHQANAMKRLEQFNATKQMAEYDRLAGVPVQ